MVLWNIFGIKKVRENGIGTLFGVSKHLSKWYLFPSPLAICFMTHHLAEVWIQVDRWRSVSCILVLLENSTLGMAKLTYHPSDGILGKVALLILVGLDIFFRIPLQ